MTLHTDYEAVTPVGATVATFSTLDLAKAFVRDNIDRLPGLRVEVVETTVVRRRAFTPRVLLVRAA